MRFQSYYLYPCENAGTNPSLHLNYEPFLQQVAMYCQCRLRCCRFLFFYRISAKYQIFDVLGFISKQRFIETLATILKSLLNDRIASLSLDGLN